MMQHTATVLLLIGTNLKGREVREEHLPAPHKERNPGGVFTNVFRGPRLLGMALVAVAMPCFGQIGTTTFYSMFTERSILHR